MQTTSETFDGGVASAATDNLTPNEATQKLWDELVLLREVWNQYDTLYRNSDDAALLDRSARWFFCFHAALLTREMVLRIARLTDNEKMGSHQNLVLASILTDTAVDAVPGLKEELEHKLEDLRERAEPVRTYRHKYIAHLDRVIADAKEAGGPRARKETVSWVLIECLINSAEDIYRRYRNAVYNSDVSFGIHVLGGPMDLIRVLRAGERWRTQHKTERDE